MRYPTGQTTTFRSWVESFDTSDLRDALHYGPANVIIETYLYQTVYNLWHTEIWELIDDNTTLSVSNHTQLMQKTVDMAFIMIAQDIIDTIDYAMESE